MSEKSPKTIVFGPVAAKQSHPMAALAKGELAVAVSLKAPGRFHGMNTARSVCQERLIQDWPIPRCPTMSLVIIRPLGTNLDPHEIVSQIGTASSEEGFKLFS